MHALIKELSRSSMTDMIGDDAERRADSFLANALATLQSTPADADELHRRLPLLEHLIEPARAEPHLVLRLVELLARYATEAERRVDEARHHGEHALTKLRHAAAVERQRLSEQLRAMQEEARAASHAAAAERQRLSEQLRATQEEARAATLRLAEVEARLRTSEDGQLQAVRLLEDSRAQLHISLEEQERGERRLDAAEARLRVSQAEERHATRRLAEAEGLLAAYYELKSTQVLEQQQQQQQPQQRAPSDRARQSSRRGADFGHARGRSAQSYGRHDGAVHDGRADELRDPRHLRSEWARSTIETIAKDVALVQPHGQLQVSKRRPSGGVKLTPAAQWPDMAGLAIVASDDRPRHQAQGS